MNKKGFYITIICAILILIIVLIGGAMFFKSVIMSEDKCEMTPKVKLDNLYALNVFEEDNELYHDISLKNEKDIEDFIAFSNLSDNFRYALFNSDSKNVEFDLNDFKLTYVISRFYESREGIYYFKIDFLKREIEKVFNKGFDLEYYTVDSSLFVDDFDVICAYEVCAASYLGNDNLDESYYSTKIVNSKKSGDNTIYTIKEYYVNVKDSNEKGSCDVYNKKEGKALIKDYCPSSYEDLIKKVNPDKLNTYEITFDKDNRYVSGKKVS